MHVLESIGTNPKPTPKTLRTCALINERLRRPLPDSWAATNREAMGSAGVRVVLPEEGVRSDSRTRETRGQTHNEDLMRLSN